MDEIYIIIFEYIFIVSLAFYKVPGDSVEENTEQKTTEDETNCPPHDKKKNSSKQWRKNKHYSFHIGK